MSFKVTIFTASGMELSEENDYLLKYDDSTAKFYDIRLELAMENMKWNY